jgi:hypothetical protein
MDAGNINYVLQKIHSQLEHSQKDVFNGIIFLMAIIYILKLNLMLNCFKLHIRLINQCGEGKES